MRTATFACLLFASVSSLADVPPSGYLHLTLLSDTLPADKGGRCMDGSMTGYYYRKGVPDTYVIFVEGGGGCRSEGTCKAWAKKAGSNTKMAKQTSGEHYGVSVADCNTNPYFCNATAAVVPCESSRTRTRRRSSSSRSPPACLESGD